MALGWLVMAGIVDKSESQVTLLSGRVECMSLLCWGSAVRTELETQFVVNAEEGNAVLEDDELWNKPKLPDEEWRRRRSNGS